MRARLNNIRRRSDDYINVGNVGIALAILSGLVALIGYLNQHYGLDLGPLLNNLIRDFYSNISAELGGIAMTVLIIDRLNQRRDAQMEERRQKERLIHELQVGNDSARRAVEMLRKKGWLQDGALHGVELWEADLHGVSLWGADLQGAYLSGANLQDADLHEANLRRAGLLGANLQSARFFQADLYAAILLDADLRQTNLRLTNLRRANLRGANLRGADLRSANLGEADLDKASLEAAILRGADLSGARHLSDAQLSQTRSLHGAIMPTGERYDGRFNLDSDIRMARRRGVDVNDPHAMARFYAESGDEIV